MSDPAPPPEFAACDGMRRGVDRAPRENGAAAAHGDADFLRRLEAAKLEALAEFAAGAGHEINNPVAVISGRAAMLLRDETDPERRRLLATIGAQALRIRDMIGDLMLFARPPRPAPERLDLAEVVRTVVSRFADDWPEGIELSVAGDATVPVWADRTQLCVVVEALLRNSLEALDGGSSPGRIEIDQRAVEADARPYGLMVIRDSGRGLTDADREHLFDPFYAGRQAGRGLGFGLCKCWRIVTQHGGWIEVESALAGPEPGWPAAAAADAETDLCGDVPVRGWTVFRVFWPAWPHRGDGDDAVSPSSATPPGRAAAKK